MLKKLFPTGIPLAWRQLVMEKKRFAVALMGVGFAVVMMIFQIGLYEAFMEMVVNPITSMKGDLAVISPNYEYILNSKPFPERRLFQALASPDVKEVYPVMISVGQWRNPETGFRAAVSMFGVQCGRNPFFQDEVKDKEYVLGLPDGVFYDRESAPEHGDIEDLLKKDEVLRGEINEKRVRVMGMFKSGRTLASNANILAGSKTFLRLTDRPSGFINLGMIELKKGADPKEAARRLNAALPEDVKVLTRSELIYREQAYWRDVTPIGYIISCGMIIAMLVGAVIVYQVLYTDINDHIKEYATLKALGLNNNFFLKLILQESSIILGIAFLPSVIICEMLFRFSQWQASIPTRLSLMNTLATLGLAAVMCMAAGYFATRRLRSADPAEVF